MPNKSSLRVSNAPPKPLLIWDGECDFCRLWIERWREITEGKVDYATYQEAAVRFPEIPVDEFTRAMAFIKPDGDVFFAAEAVYRSLAHRRSRRWLAWSYDRVPGFAAVSETGYGFIARHRNFTSAVTRLLWGNDVRRPTCFCWRLVSYRSFLRHGDCGHGSFRCDRDRRFQLRRRFHALRCFCSSFFCSNWC